LGTRKKKKIPHRRRSEENESKKSGAKKEELLPVKKPQKTRKKKPKTKQKTKNLGDPAIQHCAEKGCPLGNRRETARKGRRLLQKEGKNGRDEDRKKKLKKAAQLEQANLPLEKEKVAPSPLDEKSRLQCKKSYKRGRDSKREIKLRITLMLEGRKAKLVLAQACCVI